MPGLNQLKQFETDMLNLGDEVKIRAARSEKPVRIPIPKNISEADDSEDFVNGMPSISEDELAQVEAAAAARERESHDFSDITGVGGEDKKASAVAQATTEKLPDMTDLLSTGQDMDLSDLDLSDFEEEEEEEAPPEPEPTPIEDLDLDSLLQMSSSSTESSASSNDEQEDLENQAPKERYIPQSIRQREEDLKVSNDIAIEDLVSGDADLSFLDETPATENNAVEENSLGDVATENPLANDLNLTTSDFNPIEDDLGSVADSIAPATDDFGSALNELDSFKEPTTSLEESSSFIPPAEDESGVESEIGAVEAQTESETDNFDTPTDSSSILDLNSDLPPEFNEVSSETSSLEANAPSFETGDAVTDNAATETVDIGLDDFNLDSISNDSSTTDVTEDLPVQEEAATTPLDVTSITDDFNADDVLGNIDSIPDESTTQVADNVSSIEEASSEQSAVDSLGLADFDLDAPVTDSSAGDSLEPPQASAAETDSANALPDLPTEDIFNTSDLDSELPSFDEVPNESETSSEESDAVEQFDTSAMDGVDFSGDASGFELGGITSTEGDDEFSIPGFSDTVTANLSQKTAERASTAAGNEDIPPHLKNTFTDAEYKRFLENLEQYPLNIRIALEDFVAKNEFTDDAVFEVLEKILRKVPARQVAADLEKKMDISLQVPRDFERRSAQEYEAYKRTFEYQLKNRIIPGAVLTTVAAIVIFCFYFLTKTIIVDPVRATNCYKQGYALIQSHQYPQSEDRFNKALTFRPMKKWFYKYAEAYRDHRQYERARIMYDRILKQYDHEKAAGLAWSDMEAKDLYNYEEAERILKREVLDYHINDPDGILALGDLYLDWATDRDASKFPAAKEQYDDLLILYPKSKLLNKYLSRQMRYFIRTDNLEQVLYYKQIFYPNNKSLEGEDLVELSGYLFDKRYGNLRPAEEYLRSSIEDVRDMLEDALKAAPNNPVSFYNMGRYFVQTKSGVRGVEYFKQAIDMFKNLQYRSRRNTYKYINTYRLLGEEYCSQREYILAEQSYVEGIDLFEKEHESSGFESNEDIGKLYSDIGDLDYFVSGDMAVALSNYIKAVENKNDTASIRYRIGFIQYTNRNYGEALGSFIKCHEGNPSDTHGLLALANTLSLRDDNLAAQGYYDQLLIHLDNERYIHGVLLPQVRPDQADLVDTYMKASNNLGVTLSRIANQTGDSKKNAEAIVRLQDSLRAYDALTRNQVTMLRLEGSNLAAQNIKYITEPVSDFAPGIYTQISKTLVSEVGLE